MGLDAQALAWQVPNGDEEAARHFVFGRELDRLSDRLKRILYAVAILNQTSQIELQQVTGLPPRAVRDDIVKLREYHLIADEQPEMAGGPDITIPPGLRALSDVMRSSISDPSAVERECKAVRTQTMLQSTKAIAIYVNRVAALWAEGSADDALDLAKYADKQTKGQNADISCLLASCFLRASEPFFDADAADKEFAKSYKQGCRKIELFRGWIFARMALLNWDGVVQVTNYADIEFPSGENAYARATAYLKKGDGQLEAGSFRSAMDNYRRGAASVQEAFDGRRATGKVESLKEIRFELYEVGIPFTDLTPQICPVLQVFR